MNRLNLSSAVLPLLFILFMQGCFAYFDAESMVINYGGFNTITISHFSTSASLTDFSQSVFLYPVDANIVSSDLRNLTVSGSHLLFSKKGDFSSSGWSFNYTISNDRHIYLLNNSPVFPYPVSDFPSGVGDYLSFDGIIEYSPSIKGKADQIVSGVTDYVTAVLKLSEWVHDNIKYSFYEPYVSNVIKSSTVLSNLRGVCDEYSVLLMSFYRSEGIPARYVTGYAFGNVLGLDSFGPHAWVEVYIPNEGWISVDPTYGEHGWLDATHVSVQKIVNSSSDYITTSYSGYDLNDINITNNLPDFMRSSFGSKSSGFSIVSIKNESLFITASASVSKYILGNGEYFLLNVTINNPYDYFIPLSYEIITTSSMELINSSSWREVFLRPGSGLSSYVIVKAPVYDVNRGNRGYTYVHPFEVYIPLAGHYFFNVTVDPSVQATTSLDELVIISSPAASTGSKSLVIRNVTVTPSIAYSDAASLSFELFNNGSYSLSDINISVYGDLISSYSSLVNILGINEIRTLSIPLVIKSRGEGTIRIYASSLSASASGQTDLVAARIPSLNLSYDGPRLFSVNPSFRINITNPFGVLIDSMNLSVVTSRSSLSKSFEGGSSNIFVVNLEIPIELLSFGSNNVLFKLDYIDSYGTPFSSNLSVDIIREGAWYELIIDFFTNLLNNILRLF